MALAPDGQVGTLVPTFDSVPFSRHAWKTVLVLGPLVSAAIDVVTPRAITALIAATPMATNRRAGLVFKAISATMPQPS